MDSRFSGTSPLGTNALSHPEHRRTSKPYVTRKRRPGAPQSPQRGVESSLSTAARLMTPAFASTPGGSWGRSRGEAGGRADTSLAAASKWVEVEQLERVEVQARVVFRRAVRRAHAEVQRRGLQPVGEGDAHHAARGGEPCVERNGGAMETTRGG